MLKHISSASAPILSNVINSSGSILDADVFIKWGNIMGDELSTSSSPVKVILDEKNRRILVLRVSRYNMVNIMYKQNFILEKLNTFFGKDSFHKIKFIA